MLRKKRVLAAKIETTIGTAETLAGADAAMNVYDPVIQANVEMIDRPRQASFGGLPKIPGLRTGTATFRTEVYGDGAGGVPLWASTLLPACGFVNSGGVFSPKTESPGTNVKTVTIGVYQDGMKKVLSGAVGTAVLNYVTGQPVSIDWTFQGILNTVADVAILAPTYPTDLPPRFANSTFTVGGATPGCIESLSIDLGNTIFMRPCPGAASGIASGVITERMVTGSMNPESRLVATYDVFGKWLTGTEEALSIVLDDGTDEITFGAPKLQRTNVQEGDRSGLQIDDVSFSCNPSSGDDEFTITFDASA